MHCLQTEYKALRATFAIVPVQKSDWMYLRILAKKHNIGVRGSTELNVAVLFDPGTLCNVSSVVYQAMQRVANVLIHKDWPQTQLQRC